MCIHDNKCPLAYKCETLIKYGDFTMKEKCRLKETTETEAPLFHMVLRVREDLKKFSDNNSVRP